MKCYIWRYREPTTDTKGGWYLVEAWYSFFYGVIMGTAIDEVIVGTLGD